MGLCAWLGAASASVAALWVLVASLHQRPLTWLAAALTLSMLLAIIWIGRKIFRWNVSLWMSPYLLNRRFSLEREYPLDICFGLIDHFETNFNNASLEKQVRRIAAWEWDYSRAIEGHADSDGFCPQHTWFFPVRLVDSQVLSTMARWPGRGWGEIEYHLHHDDRPEMTPDELREMIRSDIVVLRRHGAVSSGRYGFVHGMFALAGGDSRYCRNTYELSTLIETGCYADFTFPAIGTPAQPRQINKPYYAKPGQGNKPYDQGVLSQVGQHGEGLLMIPGPLSFGLFPSVLDDANLGPVNMPCAWRLRKWVDAHVHVLGRPNWVIVLPHAHSAPGQYRNALMSGAMQNLWSSLERSCRDSRTRLHYVTARETYNIVRAAESGCTGNPNDYRDFEIPRPQNALKVAGSASTNRLVSVGA